MSFTIDKMTGAYKNKIQQQNLSNGKSEKVPTNERNFDKIVIQSNQRQIEEKKFSEGLINQVLTAARGEVSDERVDLLASRIEQGQYVVSKEKIANRILALGGVDGHE